MEIAIQQVQLYDQNFAIIFKMKDKAGNQTIYATWLFYEPRVPHILFKHFQFLYQYK